MKKTFTLIPLFLLFFVAGTFAQGGNKMYDLIVTAVGDSIQCRVLESAPTVYHVEKLDENGDLHTVSMGRGYVKLWKKGYFRTANTGFVVDEQGVRHVSRKKAISEQELKAKMYDLIITAVGDSLVCRVISVTSTAYSVDKLNEDGKPHTVSMALDYVVSWTKGYFRSDKAADPVRQVELETHVVKEGRLPQINRFRMGINGGLSIALGNFGGGSGLSLDHLSKRFGFQIGLLPQYVFPGNRHALGLAFDYRRHNIDVTSEMLYGHPAGGRVRNTVIFVAPTYTYYTNHGLFNSKSYLDFGLGYIDSEESGESLSLSAGGVGFKVGLGFVTRIKDNIGFDIKISFTGGLVFPDIPEVPKTDNVSSANFTLGFIFGNY